MVVTLRGLPPLSRENVKLSSWPESTISSFSKVRSALRTTEASLVASRPPSSTLTDDPYYFLYFGKKPRPPSYFTLELEQPEVGRVLRFDSLSKILSSGIRIGFASGPVPLLNAMDMHVWNSATLRYNTLTDASLDRDREPPSFHLDPRNRIRPPSLVGIRWVQNAHGSRLELLQGKAGRLRTCPQDPLGRFSGVGYPRSRHVRVVQALDCR